MDGISRILRQFLVYTTSGRHDVLSISEQYTREAGYIEGKERQGYGKIHVESERYVSFPVHLLNILCVDSRIDLRRIIEILIRY